MKKILITSLLICALFVVGCGNKTNAKEEAMKEYATKFYELHQKGTVGLTNPTISITQLKTAMEQLGTQYGDDYDLTKLKGCTDDSYVELKINDAKEVTEVVYHMTCE